MPFGDLSKWKLVLTGMDGSTGIPGAGWVLNTSQKQFSHQLNAGKTMQFTISIDNPAADFVLGTDTLLKVYRTDRNGNLRTLMVGDVIHAEESAQGDIGLVTVVAADPWWRLQRRLLGMDTDSIGRGTGVQVGDASHLLDNSYIAELIITSLNQRYPLGISLGAIIPTGTANYLGPLYAQNAGDIIQQLCNTLGGPEFEIVPIEPFGSNPATIGIMNIWNVLGGVQGSTVFEYGCGGHNVASYDRLLSKDGLCNAAYSPPQGFPDVSSNGDNMVIAADFASINAIGFYQDIVQGDMVSIPLRQELCNEFVQVRKYARQQLTFTPTVDCPLDYTVDYNVGDVVLARAFVNGGYRYNGTVRVYGVEISVDDNDAETPALTLIPGGQ
jgi:hypothetical protein